MGWRIAIANWIRRVSNGLANGIAGDEHAIPPDDYELYLALIDGIESLAEAFIVCDDQGKITYFNEQYRRIFPELSDVVRVGLPFTELVEAAVQRNLYSDAMGPDAGSVRLAAIDSSDDVPFLQRMRDGRTIQTRERRTKTGGFVGVRTDVTAVQRGRDMLQSLIDNIPELVTLKDKDGRYFFVNKCFETWTGTSRESIIGKTVFDVYDAKDALGYEERDRRLAKTLAPEVDEMEIRFPDGLSRAILMIAFPVLDKEGGYGGSGVICIDISERKRAEQELAEKEAQLRAALDNMPSGLLMVDEDLVIRAINRRMVTLYDLPRPVATVGTHIRELIEFRARRGDYGSGLPERQAEARLGFWRSGEKRHYEDQVPGDRTIDVRLSPCPDGGCIAICSEVTEAKRAEMELVEQSLLLQLTRNAIRVANEARDFNQALQKTVDLVCRQMDWPVGHVYLVDRANRDRLVPSGIWSIGADERFLKFKKVTSKTVFRAGIGLPGRVLESGCPVWLRDVHQDDNFPRAQVVPEISIRAGVGIPVRAGARIVAVIEIFCEQLVERDQALLDTLEQIGVQLGRVAERDEIAKATKLNAERLRLAMETMTGGILMFDRDLKILMASSSFAEIYNIPPELMEVGSSAIEVIRFRAERGDYGPGEPKELVRERIEGYYSDEAVTVIEDHIPGGRIVELFRTRTNNGDTVAVFNDVTERKHTEQKIQQQRDELERLNQQKNKFFSIIAHDLKDPFGNMLSYLELMKIQAEGGQFEKMAGYVGNALQSGQQVFDLLENLLEWSWLQMDRVEFKPDVIGIEPILEKNIALFQPVADAKGIELIVDLETLEHIYADPRMVDTVIRNLINNAIKFTESGGMVTAGVRRDGRMIEVFIRDTGLGMSGEKLARLFKPEEKVSTSGTAGEAGTGLGLILCKELVENNGGTITVESQPGDGSTFKVAFPSGEALNEALPVKRESASKAV
ncbi:PAS-domain containing protein [Aestuariispira insulae]|uniref:histidine kinase n=1 Tax=Aestuariispira insulae TaxID=1461337 RepID=A0A3D9HR90_9PROT|nr:PAS-domain containing protein [Aestuariispira insulae]RED52027.1 PAS domain S-box-containing protein [Aestuariispira insulae]